LRVIGAENEQLGVMPREEAQKLADDAELDLVEMAPNAEPPVARIMDFGKFQYDQDKQQQKQKKSKAGVVKEVRLTMKIGAHDLEYRMKRANEFLAEGQKVKFNLMMKGRENANPNAAKDRVRQLVESLDGVKIEGNPIRQGRSVSIVVTPDPKAAKKAEKAAEEAAETGAEKT
jgi:translation initiation factor IF-3